jgi:hypothetical protein
MNQAIRHLSADVFSAVTLLRVGATPVTAQAGAGCELCGRGNELLNSEDITQATFLALYLCTARSSSPYDQI